MSEIKKAYIKMMISEFSDTHLRKTKNICYSHF